MPTTRDLLSALELAGLLLVQDQSFPNVVTLMTGESLAQSWWAHPQSTEIFRHLCAMSSHRDVLLTKLINGKVTMVHRRLWKPLLAVAIAREPWQFARLSVAGLSLLERVDGEASVLTSGAAATDLERRLLVHGEQVHTPSGKHQIRLETWSAWSQRSGCQSPGSASHGQTELETAVRALGGAVYCLPWHHFSRAPTKVGSSRHSKKP
jgi:hypothetical protein